MKSHEQKARWTTWEVTTWEVTTWLDRYDKLLMNEQVV